MAPQMGSINYDSLTGQLHDPNGTQNPILYGVTIPFYVVTVPVFFARIYTRAFPTWRLWWDDLFIALAFVSRFWTRNMPLILGIY
jgi:hypothetical protein